MDTRRPRGPQAKVVILRKVPREERAPARSDVRHDASCAEQSDAGELETISKDWEGRNRRVSTGRCNTRAGAPHPHALWQEHPEVGSSFHILRAVQDGFFGVAFSIRQGSARGPSTWMP